MQRMRWLALSAVLVMLVPATLAATPLVTPPALPVEPMNDTLGEEPDAYLWDTFVLSSSSERRPGFPPELGSVASLEELVELKRIQLERTEEQVAKAEFWDDGPPTKRWSELMLDMASVYGPNPPRVARGLAYLHIAMYDAVLATWEAKHFYNRASPSEVDPTVVPAFAPRDNPSYPSEHAAVAGAAARVLSYLYPQAGVEMFEAKAMEAGLSRVWAGVNWPTDVDAGFDLGHYVADRVLAKAVADNHNKPWNGKVPDVGPCLWHPTPPAFTFPPLEPTWGSVKPIFMTIGSQFRAPPPPECGSAEWIDQHRELYAKFLTLTPEERDIANYWADGPNTVTPPGHWFVIALDLLEKHPQTTPRAARTLAYLGGVQMDAGIAVWDTKFTYWVERPVEFIRETIDPMFMSAIGTPPFPGYVSGHSGFSAGGARWLGHVFPEEMVALRAMASEAAASRFYGGIHIEADNVVGMDVGRNVASLAINRAMSDGAEA